MRAVKEPTSIDQQLALLASRGMIIDEPLARQWLANVSYYRLSGYWYGYRILPDPHDPKNPVRLDDFQAGTTFSDITALYEFDRKLRTLIHDGMERIEVALRARLGEILAAKGALSYKDASLFREVFDHAAWLATARRRIERARKRSHSITHYAKNYEDYPFWVVAEVLDFSDLSILFSGLKIEDQRTISEGFGLVVDPEKLLAKHKKSYYENDPFARWLEQLTVLRNVCAHHGRVWNRYFTPASTVAFKTIPALSALPKGQSDKLYGALMMMAFLLREVSPGSTWAQKVRTLIETEYEPLPLHSLAEIDAPDDWRDQELWH